ncbi:MAG TPA: RNA polymerase sigma factor, partial [Capillimicrobium sp.]
ALLAFLTYRLGDRHAAEDVMADTFERAMRAGRRFDARRGSEKSWLYAIAVNLVRDRARRSAVEERVLRETAGALETDDSLDVAGRVSARQSVSQAMTVLSPEEREVIALRYGGDLTVPEIARVLDLELTTVEGRVYRALRKLRVELDER